MIDDVTGTFKVHITQDVQQPIVTKLFLLAILGLVQTVGIDKKRLALDGVYLLTLELQSRPEANRCIGEHLDKRDI